MTEQQTKGVLDAKRAITQGAVEIWSVRLELLRELGDFRGVINHLKTPAEVEDTNAGCNGNCWCGAPQPDSSLPASEVSKIGRGAA